MESDPFWIRCKFGRQSAVYIVQCTSQMRRIYISFEYFELSILPWKNLKMKGSKDKLKILLIENLSLSLSLLLNSFLNFNVER